MVVGMMRDNWWWPWWVSTLIDLGVGLVALAVFRRSSHRIVRAVAGLFVLVGLVAAVMAPIVMTEPASGGANPPMMQLRAEPHRGVLPQGLAAVGTVRCPLAWA